MGSEAVAAYLWLSPGCSCWDAIEAIFHRITFRPQYVLKVDIAKCFDRINHEALLAKTQASPTIRRQLKAAGRQQERASQQTSEQGEPAPPAASDNGQ